jgi:hypothetical protein
MLTGRLGATDLVTGPRSSGDQDREAADQARPLRAGGRLAAGRFRVGGVGGAAGARSSETVT